MDAFAGLTFGASTVLWLLAVVPLTTWFLLRSERRRRALASRFALERVRGVSNSLRPARPWLLTFALVLAVVAAAQPRYGVTREPVVTSEANRVVAIDLSESMGARDVGTSRLTAAKAVASRLVQNFDGRVALVVFEGEARTVSPLTTDTAAVVALIESLQTGELDSGGSDIAEAILQALNVTRNIVTAPGELIVISDGEHRGAQLDPAIQKARDRRVTVSTILVGSSEGTSIPVRESLLRDDKGEIVITRATAEHLERIASATGGRFFDNPFGASALAPIERSGESFRRDPSHDALEVPVERYQLPLTVAVVLFLAAAVVHRGAE